jgi:hypothetical protein
MFWLRYRVSTLMAVVAMTAAVSGLCEMRRRGHSCRLRAEYHLAASRQLANDARSFLCTFGMTQSHIEQIEREQRARRRTLLNASDYHLRLHAKYERASERPWLLVCPDPEAPPDGNPALVSADDY